MMNLIPMIACFIIGTIPILFGAVQPRVWSFYGLLMTAAFVLAIWIMPGPSLFNSLRKVYKPVALFFMWTLFLCLPVSFPVLSIFSPNRAEILSTAGSLTGVLPARAPMAYASGSALAWWVFLLGLGLFFLVVRELCMQKKMLERLVFVMIAIGVAESVYGLIQALVPTMGVLWIDYVHAYLGTARGTFINRNNFAGLIEMIWPLALGLTLAMGGRMHSFKAALASDRLNRQALMALGIIVFLLSLILTRSRAGIACGFIGFLTYWFMARRGIRMMASQSRLLMGGIVVLLAVYTMSIGIGPVMKRFLAIAGDSSSRLDIWRDSLPMVIDYPLGIGLKGYADVFKVYQHTFVSNKTVIYAHNDYLQLLIETGWIGFIALLGSFLVFLVRCARRIHKLDFREYPLHFYLAVGAFSGLVSIAVHSLFDFNLQIPADGLYFVVLIAILSACTGQVKAELHEK
jgi:O-antigen ligase